MTGQLWESEHGPQGGDEINIIEPGHNYGWGVITMGVQPGITKRAQEGMEQPIVYYTPTIAPSGIAFYTGTRYPGWKNNLFVSGLAGQQLRRLEVKRRQGHASGSALQPVRPRARRRPGTRRLSLRDAAAAGAGHVRLDARRWSRAWFR